MRRDSVKNLGGTDDVTDIRTLILGTKNDGIGCAQL